MGNTSSGGANAAYRQRQKSTEIQRPNEALVFEKKPNADGRRHTISENEKDDINEAEGSSFDVDGVDEGLITEIDGTEEANQIEGRDKKLPTVFKWEGGGKEVCISGTFSDWKPIPMVKSHGDFVTIVDLPEGEHEYKFCVDGDWKYDPTIKVVDNPMGTKNNVVTVRNSDFEVFQALDVDSESSNSNTQQREYGQDVPVLNRGPWDRSNTATPPILPPHLLQIILNKDTPLSCEPTLLPEPNHVMLNHLYALSIKEGVMVLSATHRYRKKYVTTLLYKPI